MGKPGAFLDLGRRAHDLRPVAERTGDYDELYVTLPAEEQRAQASRCMMCGVAFCQTGVSFGKARPSGCPLHNLIPEWNDLLYRGQWAEAAKRLSLTSPLPEFTSRVCPALCEAACNLGRDDEPETIHDNERAISDWEWAHGGPMRFSPAAPDAPRVAVVGSGPPAWPRLQELTRRGARVTVGEGRPRWWPPAHVRHPQHEAAQGRGGAPRGAFMRELGIEFRLETDASEADVAEGLLADFAVVVAAGGRCPARAWRRGFNEGLEADGVVFAVDYLASATKVVLATARPPSTAGKGRRGHRRRRHGQRLPGHGRAPGAPGACASWSSCPARPRSRWRQTPGRSGPTSRRPLRPAEAIAPMGAEMREWAVDTLEVLRDEGRRESGIRVVDLDWSAGRPERRMEPKASWAPSWCSLPAASPAPKADVLSALGVELAHEGASAFPVMACRCSHRAAGSSARARPVYVAGDARNGGLCGLRHRRRHGLRLRLLQSWGSSHADLGLSPAVPSPAGPGAILGPSSR